MAIMDVLAILGVFGGIVYLIANNLERKNPGQLRKVMEWIGPIMKKPPEEELKLPEISHQIWPERRTVM